MAIFSKKRNFSTTFFQFFFENRRRSSITVSFRSSAPNFGIKIAQISKKLPKKLLQQFLHKSGIVKNSPKSQKYFGYFC